MADQYEDVFNEIMKILNTFIPTFRLTKQKFFKFKIVR